MRVADEFIVDIMKAAGDIEYDKAQHFVKAIRVHEVEIPFASPVLLL